MLNFISQQMVFVDVAKRGDQALTGRLSDAAEQRFHHELGIDLRAPTPTDRGFVQRG